MQTKQIIEASAEIVSVLTLRKGDVYKRLDEPSYGGPKLIFGVVTDVLHNGEDAAFTALEYEGSYRNVEISLKVFGTSSEIKIFAATAEEFQAAAGDLIAAAQGKVKSAQDDLAKAEGILASVQSLAVREVRDTLTVGSDR